MSDAIVQNPYAVPGSDLHERPASGVPSIEEALSRGYNFSLGNLLGEAWNKTKGTKLVVWGGLLVFYGAMIAASLALLAIMSLFGAVGIAGLGMGMGDSGDSVSTGMMAAGFLGFAFIGLTFGLILTALMYPFIGGINMVGIRQAAGQPVRFAEVFSHFGRTLPLLLAAILMGVLISIGYAVFILPGIYLSFALMLTIPLIVERKLSAWQAIVTSIRAINQHWFKVFFLYILLAIILILSMLPLGIGLIWTVPMFIVAQGVLYRTIFGVLPPAN
ncbi:hypothetical protein A9179_16415 [Pseudomonas alcaligenes]|uniref:Integral membrane protein n=1 Tax=Aquipseudomonas alcaligenes TaxID=43263 RepID=A0ABR7S2Q6_AQUAC|nr:hypothetical protein [Pseudomonas alcaligenes]MBC9251855.1 hypothetical protein [Pseudomonas alcaligenes]